MSSKFFRLESPVALPAQCFSCGKAKGEFIDLQFQAEYYGAVIACIQCAQEIGRQSGLVEDAERRAAVLQSQAEQLIQIVLAFEGAVSDAVHSTKSSLEQFSLSVFGLLPLDSSDSSEPEDFKSDGSGATEDSDPGEVGNTESGTHREFNFDASIEGSDGVPDPKGKSDFSFSN